MFEWLKRFFRKLFGKNEPVEVPTLPVVDVSNDVVVQKPMEREAESEPKTSTVSQPETLSTPELPQSVQAEVAFQQGLISTMKEVLAAKEPPPAPTTEVKTGNGEYIWLAQRPTEDGGINVALVPVEPKTKAPEIAPPKKKKEGPKKTRKVKATIKVDVPKDKKSKKAK